MSRGLITLLALVFLWSGLSLPAQASIKPYNKLSPDEWAAFQASQQRLAQLDNAMRVLVQSRDRKKISARDYAFYEHDLTCYIAAEANLQNQLLIQPHGLAEDKRELLQNIAKYAVEVPLFLAGLAARIFVGGGGSFSP